MRTVVCMLVSAMLLSLTACGKSGTTGGTGGTGGTPQAAAKSKDLIVGVWEIVDEKSKGTQEFKADGTVVMTLEANDKKMEMPGKYKFLEEDVVELEIAPPGDAPKITQKLKLTKLTKDEMVMKDEKGKEDKFKKVK